MKVHFYYLAFLFASISPICAQLQKGGNMLGGNFNLSGSNEENTDTLSMKPVLTNKTTNYVVNFRWGKLLNDRLMIGPQIGYGQFQQEQEQNQQGISTKSTSKDSRYTIGVFSRYYRKIGESRFAAFGQAAALYTLANSHIVQRSTYPGTNTFSQRYFINSFKLSLNAGITYFVTPKIGIETYFGDVGYTYSSRKVQNGRHKTYQTTTSSFNSALSLSVQQIFIGVNFYL